MSRTVRRCAIYTRKSTEDGLDQEFNSLDAQREACEAFIASQRSEGWKALAERYDDGGVSGGTLERAAIQRLLTDVDSGKIDIVVVYKIDRLTRSLADFAKIVERFEKREVSFVSVTQSFNTSSSMGRLTLNVLLSFAQFEREVTAERIRDKIAASKKKGLWMGGYVPLGYDAVDRKLIVNLKEAPIVRSIFKAFIDGANVKELAAELGAQGLRSKQRANGKGGSRFSRGALYKILSNPIYRGEVAHGKHRYPGIHEAIIDPDIWEKAAARLEAGKRRAAGNVKGAAPLTGKIFADGEPLTPTHAKNHGRRYRYYVSRSLVDFGASDAKGWRLPAAEIEAVIADLIRGWLKECADNEDRRSGGSKQSIDAVRAAESAIAQAINDAECTSNLALLNAWRASIREILLDDSSIALKLDPAALPIDLNGIALSTGNETADTNECDNSKCDEADDRSASERRERSVRTGQFGADASDLIVIERPIRFARRGVGRKLILGDARINPDKGMIDLILLVRRWRAEIFEHGAAIKDLAARDGIDQGDASRYLPLAFLSPDHTLAILEGRQPPSLTAETLKRLGALPIAWREQRRLRESARS